MVTTLLVIGVCYGSFCFYMLRRSANLRAQEAIGNSRNVVPE